MRCREALRSIGAYIDGELAGKTAVALKSHLEACPRCRQRMAYLREVVREVSSLPAIRPTPAERVRLVNRVRSEMAGPAAPRPAVKWARVTAAAFSILVLVTGAAVWAILGSGEPATRVGEAPSQAEAPEDFAAKTGKGAASLGGQESNNSAAASVPASLARPELVVSGREYAPGELADFRSDIATRLKFYSAYWQPQASGTAGEGVTRELQQRLAEDLAGQAQAAGADPQGLRSALDAALARADSETFLPCYAELAKVEGREVWLVSLSGPEDCLLFPDPGVSQSVVLASLGGEEGLKISRSLLQELVAELAPADFAIPGSEALRWGTREADATTVTEEDAGAVAQDSINGSAAPIPGGAGPRARGERDFQAFLDEVFARTNNLDALRALERLNYEQVLMLLEGDWAGLAADGVNLSEFLSPPQRVWAVDAGTAEVVWPL